MPFLWKPIFLFTILAVNLLQAQHQEVPIAGPMAARVYADQAIIWVQLRQEAHVRCQCQLENDTLRIQSSQEITRQEDDFIAWMQLEGLLANHYYACELWVDGEAKGEEYTTRFRTLPQNHEPINFSMAVGSCAYLADYQYESRRQLLPYGGKYHIYDTIATHQADFMFWLGDNIYLRNGEWNSKEGVQYRYRHTRFHPALQDVMRTGSHFAIWDDHDFGPNDGDSTYQLRKMTGEIFKQVWPNPLYADSSKLYTQYRIGDVAFFLMDDRSHRAPNEAPIDSLKPFLGKEQLNWLIESLRTSDASFKIISIGTQVLSNCNLAEGYIFGYPNELDEMLSLIQQEQIEGVIFFSGDKHLTEISRYDYPGLYPLLDVTISPFTSMPTPIKLSNSHRVKGTFVGRRNFGILNFVGEGEERRMIIRIFNAKGKMIWQKNIWARDLKIGE